MGPYNNEDFKFDKFAVNSIIGAFKPKEKEQWKSIGISDNPNNIFYHYLKDNNNKIDVMNIDNKNYFHLYRKYLTTQEETEAPIYNMVLELEAIELHKLTDIIKSKGGEVLDLVTDCVVCSFPNDQQPFELDGVNIKDYEFSQNVPKYKLEHKETRLKVEMMKNHIRTEKANIIPQQWQTFQDSQNDNLDKFVNDILDQNLSININGLAGTGKSTLVHNIMKEMNNRDLKYYALAPTNKAARIIKGETISKFIARHPQKILKTPEFNVDYIIIDEISMMHECFYKYFLVLQKMKPNIRFILSGNFDQLLPVNDRVAKTYDVDYFNSPALFDLCSGNRLELTKCRRADDRCYNKIHPTNISNLKASDFGNKFATRHICFTNKKRIVLNKWMMDAEVKRKRGKKPLVLEALPFDNNSQDVSLLAGMPVIARVNDINLGICNNETFKIKEIQYAKENILIEDDEFSLDIPFDRFQKLFYVAYAITIHRSQGETYDHDYTIHEWDKLDKRLKYVALSRTTKLENINVR